MEQVFALVIAFGLVISVVTILFSKGDNIMSMQRSDLMAAAGLPPTNSSAPGGIEIATFALG
jgi:hypothetical protein